jgi:hypothetical protein
MSYLARLEAATSARAATLGSDKANKRPSGSFISPRGEHISGDESAYYRWRVTLPDGTPFEVCCLPSTTAAEMRALYPGAALKPLSDSPNEAGL